MRCIPDLEIQEDTLNSIRRISRELETQPSPSHNMGYFEARNIIMNQYWQTFKEQHRILIRMTSKDDRQKIMYFSNRHYERVEELYLRFIANIINLKEKYTASQPPKSPDDAADTMAMFETTVKTKPFEEKQGANPNMLEKDDTQHQSTSQSAAGTNISLQECPICETKHSIFLCEGFVKLSPSLRLNVVRSFDLCINCLRDNHNIKKCTARPGCRKCNEFHSTLLHGAETLDIELDSFA